MPRIMLHRTERERGWPRWLGLALMLLLFGCASCILVRILDAEAIGLSLLHAGSRMPAGETPLVPRDVIVGLGLLLAPALGALLVGLHTVRFGGFYGFLLSLFHLLPLPIGGAGGMDTWQARPLIWGAFLIGTLLAFYLGDLGSWLCRRRLLREAKHDVVLGLSQGRIEPLWGEELA